MSICPNSLQNEKEPHFVSSIFLPSTQYFWWPWHNYFSVDRYEIFQLKYICGYMYRYSTKTTLWPNLDHRGGSPKAERNEDNWLEPDVIETEGYRFVPTTFQELIEPWPRLGYVVFFYVEYLEVLPITVAFGLSNPYLVEVEHFLAKSEEFKNGLLAL